MTIGVVWSAATHVGRVRKSNQDSVVADLPVFVVADGMGGVAGGEVASAAAIARFEGFRGAAAVDADSVLAAVRSANSDVFARRFEDSERADMGTTLAGVALTRQEGTDVVLVFNVGDSRVYMSRGADFRRVTTDHSVVAELVAAGEIEETDAATHPERNVVTRVIGGAPEVEVDSWVIAPEIGDRFLICSDGLTGEIDDAALASAMFDTSDTVGLVNDLVEGALASGGRDNVSVVVLAVTSIDEAPIDVDEDTDPRPAVAEGTSEPR